MAVVTPDEFRQHGHALIDWIADYTEGVEQYPVASQVQPGDIRAMLPEHPPAHAEPFADVLADLDRVVMPGITHWQHPSFFAYFPGNGSYPAILGDLAASGLGVQGMSWVTSPACTEMETLMVDWMQELLGLNKMHLVARLPRADGGRNASVQCRMSRSTLPTRR